MPSDAGPEAEYQSGQAGPGPGPAVHRQAPLEQGKTAFQDLRDFLAANAADYTALPTEILHIVVSGSEMPYVPQRNVQTLKVCCPRKNFPLQDEKLSETIQNLECLLPPCSSIHVALT